MIQHVFAIQTSGRGTTDITSQVQTVASQSDGGPGMCNVFIQHTSASLIICENAAPEVHTDIETFMSRIVPDGDPAYLHDDEGPDDMPAHIRNILTQNSITIPVNHRRCQLGTWQGIYLWEHRTHPHTRKVIVTVS